MNFHSVELKHIYGTTEVKLNVLDEYGSGNFDQKKLMSSMIVYKDNLGETVEMPDRHQDMKKIDVQSGLAQASASSSIISRVGK